MADISERPRLVREYPGAPLRIVGGDLETVNDMINALPEALPPERMPSRTLADLYGDHPVNEPVFMARKPVLKGQGMVRPSMSVEVRNRRLVVRLHVGDLNG